MYNAWNTDENIVIFNFQIVFSCCYDDLLVRLFMRMRPIRDRLSVFGDFEPIPFRFLDKIPFL